MGREPKDDNDALFGGQMQMNRQGLVMRAQSDGTDWVVRRFAQFVHSETRCDASQRDSHA